MPTESKNSESHYIVGIGASAGGLEAYNEFFDHAAENQRISYILVQHLSPDYKSLLVDLLSRHTHMKVYEAQNNMEIEPNCIYVIPPRKNLTVTGKLLTIRDKDATDKGPNTSIDTFFYSLANSFGDKAIAVILSGTGTDGSRGIEAIKDREGLVIVQDPEKSKFDGMPRSSIATGRVDLVLPTKDMYAEILNYINEIPNVNLTENAINEETLNKVLHVLHKQTGCDFQQYKPPTILRRLARRLAFLKIGSVEEYLDYIILNTNESKVFCKDLLIGVTRFFRDKDAFDALRDKVLVPLVDSKNEYETIKVWVTACSTGEEVYSIAMLLNEIIQQRNKKIDLKIFGTDLDMLHIEKASKAEYPEYINKEVPKHYLDKYFLRKESGYVVAPDLRKQVVFAKHNVITDPPFIKNDLISCRNMLIYMNLQLQKIILSKFSFGLNANGFLFLGPSETLANNKELYIELDRKWKLYNKVGSDPVPTYPGRYEERLAFHANFKKEKTSKPVLGKFNSLQDHLNTVLLEDFSIAAFYIDKNYIIRETAGDYKKYLTLPDEGLRFNLLKMLPDFISIPLNTAIIKVWKYNETVLLNKIQYQAKGHNINLSISIRPSLEPSGYTLVIFNSIESLTGKLESHDEATTESSTLENLKRELKESRFNLQTAIEELETTNEELQSSNEELLSSNEELQSSNEELQSLNEELHTLNTEHQLRIQELIELNDDLNNYFRCSDIGQVIVDRSLNIRKFNPAAAKLINLIENDVSRPITHLKTNFKYDKFENDIKEVLNENKIVEKEINVENGTTLLLRIYSYIRKNNVIDGALISFIDVTGYKKLNDIINGVFDASKNSIIALSALRNRFGHITDLVNLTSNTVANKLFNKDLSEKQYTFSEISKQLNDLTQKDLIRVIESGESFNTELGLEGKWFDVSAVKMGDGLALTLNDITDRKRIEDQLRKNYGELLAAKENLKTLNQNLENRFNQRTRELAISEERFRLVSTVTNDVLVDWNFMNNQLWASNNYHRLLGYDVQSEALTRQFWVDKIHPDDQARVLQDLNDFINTCQESWSIEYRYKHNNGSYRLINDRGFLMLDENGTPFRMLSSMLDITNLRQAEKELRDTELRLELALNAAEMAGWFVDAKTGAVTFTENLPVIFGHKKEDSITADQLRGQYIDEDKKLLQQAREKAIETGIYEYEARIKHTDNNIRWIKTSGVAIKDENGQVSKMIGITRDITLEKIASIDLENKVAERTLELSTINEKLKKSNSQLARSNDDLEQFAYIASHDLQEPLRKIQTFISILNNGDSNPVVSKKYLEKISSSAARMSSLIKNVLEFSRLTKKEEGLSFVDLNEIIKDLLVDFELSILEKNAQIEVGNLPTVYGVSHQLSQLFQNLISNALKFTTTKPIIAMWSHLLTPEDIQSDDCLEEGGKYVAVYVKDNGIGFDQKHAHKIFSFFYRLENSEDNYKGNGIGLALCKKIVENHEGLISVQSEKGAGTVFKIVFPVLED